MHRVRALAPSVFALVVLTIFSARVASAQANINEGLELYSFWVDGTNGCDCNPGTEALPFATITYAASQAVANNQAGKGTHVWIQNGTYRETISLTGSSADTTWPITFEAVNHGDVTISGGVVYTGFSVYSGNSSIYTTAWNNTWGVCATVTGCPTTTYPQPNIMLRQEMLAVNGTALTEVLSVAQMQPGTFYPDTTNKTLYVWPPSGTNMSTATVDVATNPTILTLAGKSNMVWRGFVFQYANSCRSVPAVAVTGGGGVSPINIEFDSDTFQWNNGQGIAIDNPTTYYTVSNSSALHNGDAGFQSYNMEFGLWENDTVGYNNWRGAQGAYYACNTGGFHSWEAHTDTIDGFTALYNQGYGIHWDTDNIGITASGIVSSQNLLAGLFAEVDPGPISISSSYSCNQNNVISQAGVGIRNSEAVSLTSSLFYNNSGSQIAVIGQPGGISITDWLTGKVYNLISQGLVNTGNTIEGVGSSQLLFSDASLNGSDWTTFLIGFDSNNNDWWNASNSTTEFEVPVPLLSTFESLSGWQTTTLQDLNSTFVQPSGSPQNACAVTADAPDFWIVDPTPTQTLDNSGKTTFTLTIMPLDGFSGTVNFTLDGISEVNGFSAANPASVGGGSGSTTLTVTDSQSTPVATYPVTVIANSGNTTHTITVNVTVPSTSIRLSTDQLTFGNQTIDSTSTAQHFTIHNYGKAAVAMTSVTASSQYIISSNNCGTSLAVGATCTVDVEFSPTLVGTVTGTVTIVDGDPTSPQTVALTGTGVGLPVASFSVSNLAFGQVLVKSPSVESFTLTNTGASSLIFTGGNAKGIKITGTDPTSYSQTNTCGTSLAVNAVCTITVTFTPQTSGSLTADVTFTDNTSTGTQNISLSGSGAYPTVKLTPSTIAFGNIEVGYSSGSMSSTLTNSGQVNLTITALALSGAHPSEYTETNTCIGTFAPNATCTITATFSPTASGSQAASVTITDNTSTKSSTLNLSGSGALPTATLSPASDSFGTVDVGSSSAAKVSTLTNNSAYLLQVKTIAISGADPSSYSYTTTCPVGSTLAAHGTCTISVTFTPTTTGTLTGTLTETDNTSVGSHTVSLPGTGAN